jgi:transcriptional regulator GlxA family with amidase domain
MDYVHTVRIKEAKRILETTDASIERISEEVSYIDPALFRRLSIAQVGADTRRVSAVRKVIA